jgi:DNA mismatch repair protein MutS2
VRPIVSEKTRAHLEWPRLLERLSSHCRGSVARERALALDFASSPEELELRLGRVTEARALLDSGEVPELGDLLDVRKAVMHAARGGVLEAQDLFAVGRLVEASLRCRRFLNRQLNAAPRLAALLPLLAELPGLARDIFSCIDERGLVKDDASPELLDLRRRLRGLREDLERRIQSYLTDRDYADLLQDDFYTIREGRYVLPIKTTQKGQVPGIVHGWSNTGHTVFIEPEAVVETNNRVKLIEADAEREVYRILARLSSEVGAEGTRLEGMVEGLALLDLSFAAGALSKELFATEPVLGDDPVLELRQARHPLLDLGGVRPVPNDIKLAAGTQVLVVTGPNTGGKTVILKTAGLCTLLAHAGLHIPAADRSRVPRVPGVFSDIGDEQSIERHLSTFSGHLVNLMAMFSEVQPGSLVLLDELAAGTDPVQGAALAQAILESFAERGALALVTTHYQSLKVLPFSDARFKNGAMGVNPQTGAPTYRLTLDVPGASSALQTARRLGLDARIVERAESLAGQSERSLEAVLQKLDAETETARREREALARERQQLDKSLAEVREQERVLRARIKEGVKHERDAALDEARTLRDEIRALKRELREDSVRRSAELLEVGQQRADAILDRVTEQQRAEQRAEAGPPFAPDELRPGTKVWVLSLKRAAEVVTVADERGRLDVRSGKLLVEVDVHDLVRPSASAASPEKPRPRSGARPRTGPPTPAPPPAGSSSPGPDWQSGAPQTADNTLDLRGQRAEEALDSTERFLDQQIARDNTMAYIIHGHGTGALKREVRNYLRTCGYARAFRPGYPHEGGDGVTAVWLR